MSQLAEGIVADLWRDFWIRETGTSQQVAQLHDRYMIMMKRVIVALTKNSRAVGMRSIIRSRECSFPI